MEVYDQPYASRGDRADRHNTLEQEPRLKSTRRQMIPIRASDEPVNFMSSKSRAMLMNPNIAKKDFNPILHTKGYHNSSVGDLRTTYEDYGEFQGRNRGQGANQLIAPNTTAGSNRIF